MIGELRLFLLHGQALRTRTVERYMLCRGAKWLGINPLELAKMPADWCEFANICADAEEWASRQKMPDNEPVG